MLKNSLFLILILTVVFLGFSLFFLGKEVLHMTSVPMEDASIVTLDQ